MKAIITVLAFSILMALVGCATEPDTSAAAGQSLCSSDGQCLYSGAFAEAQRIAGTATMNYVYSYPDTIPVSLLTCGTMPTGDGHYNSSCIISVTTVFGMVQASCQQNWHTESDGTVVVDDTDCYLDLY